MTKIPVLFSFARSGGTLVNQLLGVHPDCIVLSEINPAAAVISIPYQACEWLKLISTDNLLAFQTLPYLQQIEKLVQLSKNEHKKLIIRDWVTINFLPNILDFDFVPSGFLEQELYLKQAGFKIQPLVITRKGMDVYHSIRHHFIQFQALSLEVFAEYYLMYAQAVSDFPKVSLESLQSSPRKQLIEILEYFDFSTDYVDNQIKTFSQFENCTGNNSLAITSETSKAKIILPNIRHVESDEALLQNKTLLSANRLLGYDND